MMRAFLMCCLLMIGLCSFSTVAHAQNVLTETFVSRDQSFKFDYVPGWQTQDEYTYTLLTGRTDTIPTFGFFFFSPTLITRFVGGNDTPDILLNRLRSVFSFITEDARQTTIKGRNAAAAAADIGNDTIGFAFLIEMSDGGYGLALALSKRENLENLIPLSVVVIATYDVPTYEDILRANVPVTPVPSMRLNHYAADAPRLVAELELSGIIAPGSRLLYETELLEVKGEGTGFNRPEPDLVLEDVMMMGELAFTPGVATGLESCAILARVTSDLSQYLEIGLDNTGKIYYFDTFGTTLNDIFSASIGRVPDFQRPLYIIMIVRDETLIVFINGLPLANSVRVHQRDGSFGVVMRAKTPSTSCQIHNLRVYDLSGTCDVVANIPLNLRAGPGLAFETVGNMAAGESRRALAYRYNAFEQQRWWQLDDEAWVREDVVTETGGCHNLPPIN